MDAQNYLADPGLLGSNQIDIPPPDQIDAQPDAQLADEMSAERICRDYAPRVFRVARRMVASDCDAEDVTQDVLLQVVRKLPEFRGESALPTWLHRVTVNAALSHRRRQAVREERAASRSVDGYGDDELQLPDRPTPPPEELLADRELKQLIDRAVAGLPAAYRVVFELSDIEGMPNADIAARLDMSLPAVKSRLHRARAMLRDALSPHLTA
jgi:RNA polymerase sigma-70 factor (ECF subfamily)